MVPLFKELANKPNRQDAVISAIVVIGLLIVNQDTKRLFGSAALGVGLGLFSRISKRWTKQVSIVLLYMFFTSGIAILSVPMIKFPHLANQRTNDLFYDLNRRDRWLFYFCSGSLLALSGFSILQCWNHPHVSRYYSNMIMTVLIGGVCLALDLMFDTVSGWRIAIIAILSLLTIGLNLYRLKDKVILMN